jgi:hypothetical protein
MEIKEETIMDKRITDKILKITALAERGVGGEKVIAQNMLCVLQKKYKLKRLESSIKERNFKYIDKYDRIIFAQCVWHFFNQRVVPYVMPAIKTQSISVNDDDYICFLEFYYFHKAQFEKNKKAMLEKFTEAYVQKHKLFEESPKLKTLSGKEYKEQRIIKKFVSNEKYVNKNAKRLKVSDEK